MYKRMQKFKEYLHRVNDTGGLLLGTHGFMAGIEVEGKLERTLCGPPSIVVGSWSVAGMQWRHSSIKPLYVVCIMHVSDFAVHALWKCLVVLVELVLW